MNLLQIAIGLALAATVLVLFLGLFSMARGGTFNAKYGNLLMRLRVIVQGIAATLIAVAMALMAYGFFDNG